MIVHISLDLIHLHLYTNSHTLTLNVFRNTFNKYSKLFAPYSIFSGSQTDPIHMQICRLQWIFNNVNHTKVLNSLVSYPSSI
jgi:hypothetical protein